MANITKDTHNYEAMFQYIKEFIANKTTHYSLDERNILSVAFKRSIQKNRQAIKFVSDIIESQKFNQFSGVLGQFRDKLHTKIVDQCLEITSLCQNECQPLAENSESKVFFMKLQGDFYRYAAETFDS